MKRQNHLVSRLFPGITLTLALAGAGCGVAVDTEGPADGVRPDLPDVQPDVPDYRPDADGVMRFHAADGVLHPIAVRGTAYGGNADGAHQCPDSSYDHYEHGGNKDDTQLHVIGVYTSSETLASLEHENGPVAVKVDRAGRSVLVLAAYEPITWNIEVAEGATLERIIVSGYYDQVVNAPAGVPIAAYSYETDGQTLHVGHAWPSFDTTALVDQAEALTGLELTSFRGCYSAESFEIGEPGALRPPHAESPGTAQRFLAGCEALATESNACITEVVSGGKEYTMVGLDSGATCGQLVSEVDGAGFAEASLAWLGDYLYTCVPERGIARISILDGSVDIAPIMCSGVTVHDGGLLALVTFDEDLYAAAGWYVARFASFADLVARNAEEVYEMAPWGTRLTAHGDKVYVAWHSTSEFQHATLADGAEFQSTALEGYDDWIFGMDVTDDGKLVTTVPDRAGTIRVWDVATGALERTVPDVPYIMLGGIDCASGRAAE